MNHFTGINYNIKSSQQRGCLKQKMKTIEKYIGTLTPEEREKHKDLIKECEGREAYLKKLDLVESYKNLRNIIILKAMPVEAKYYQ